MGSITTHPTPNPNSLKITRTGDPFISGGMESFGSAAEAAGHPIGEPLFAIPGVINVFILPDFVTVTKDPGVSWDGVLSEVKK
ncbi:MAG: scaffolding protein, partial [Rhodothermales bacterium]|nr:scaffolding protein [Rhodothermales bacterium]